MDVDHDNDVIMADLDTKPTLASPGWSFEQIPIELLLHIFQFLDAMDLATASKICTTFAYATKDEILWHRVFHRKYPCTYRSLVGTQSRWDFTSNESKMFLYFMEKGAQAEPLEPKQQHEIEVSQIIHAMNAFPKFIALQQEICYVFRRLCYQQAEIAENLAEKNQILIAKNDGIKLIAKIMKDFPSVEGIQMEAAAALINLALNDDNKVAIARNEGIQLVTTAMRNHSENMSIHN